MILPPDVEFEGENLVVSAASSDEKKRGIWDRVKNLFSGLFCEVVGFCKCLFQEDPHMLIACN